MYICMYVYVFVFLQRLDPAEQMQHIGHLRKAIQYAAQDAREGKLPGFCIVGKVYIAILLLFIFYSLYLLISTI